MKRNILFTSFICLISLFVASCGNTPSADSHGSDISIPSTSTSDSYVIIEQKGTATSYSLPIGESEQFSVRVSSDLIDEDVTWSTTSTNAYSFSEFGHLIALKEGSGTISVSVGNCSDSLVISIFDDTKDPYINVDKDEFYSNYSCAKSYRDATYRTAHNLMSGDIETPEQAPTIISSRPKNNDKYIRNTSYSFNIDQTVYTIRDVNGDTIQKLYKGGAYITLEDVAAYVFAFGEIPANYVADTDTSPSSNPWGKYLRLNFNFFSCNTTQYPYEPKLPNASLDKTSGTAYYEMDVGTTGTDCDPRYENKIYNDGSYITRGAARIVFSYRIDNEPITDLDNRYVFYTYNHYNDFREYLNYYNGWGDMFGNITGGGTISSKQDYNPTPYVETIKQDLFEQL